MKKMFYLLLCMCLFLTGCTAHKVSVPEPISYTVSDCTVLDGIQGEYYLVSETLTENDYCYLTVAKKDGLYEVEIKGYFGNGELTLTGQATSTSSDSVTVRVERPIEDVEKTEETKEEEKRYDTILLTVGSSELTVSDIGEMSGTYTKTANKI